MPRTKVVGPDRLGRQRGKRDRGHAQLLLRDAVPLPRVRPVKLRGRRLKVHPRWETPLPEWAQFSYGPPLKAWAKRTVGIELLPWQAAAMDRALACDVTGQRMAHRLYLVSTGRQNGKSTAARALLDWVVTGSSPLWRTCLGLAYDRVQATRLYEQVLIDVEGLPDINATLASGIRGPSGAEYKVTSREARSQVRGLTLDLGAFDEVATHKSALVWEALVPTMSTRPQALVLAMSTAGTPEAKLLRGWYERGVSACVSHEPGPLGMTWYGAHEDAADDDPAAILAANPSGLVTQDALLFERASMTREAWRRERLNIWSEGSTDPGIVLAAWQAQARPGLALSSGEEGDPVILGADAPGSWSRATVSVAGMSPETGLPHIAVAGELVAGERGSVPPSEALHMIGTAYERWQPAVLLYDGTGALAPHIESVAADRSWRIQRANRAMMAAAAQHLDALVMGSEVTHSADMVYAMHISSAVRMPTGDGWRWSRKASLAPIDALQSAALAVLGLTRPEFLPTLQVW